MLPYGGYANFVKIRDWSRAKSPEWGADKCGSILCIPEECNCILYLQWTERADRLFAGNSS